MKTLAATLLLALACGAAQPAVPHEDAAPAYAEEQTILQTEKDQPEPGWTSPKSGRNHFDRHFIVPPGNMPEQDLILQRGGNSWRTLRNGPLATISGVLLMLVPLVLLAVWRFMGPAHTPPETGRAIRRFTDWQRLIHWSTAITFLVLAVSGLLLLFGKQVVLPWLGHTAFSWLAIASKYLHNFVGPLFIACSVAMFASFLRRNVFARSDWLWLRRAGGLIGKGPVPAGYFNAGEKMWFWFGVTLLGLLMSVTGLVLNFPYWGGVGESVGSTRYVQQWANVLHLVGATLYIAAAMGHMYIGTLGTPGAYRGMREGHVDESWAQAHHALWYEQVRRGEERVGEPRGAGTADTNRRLRPGT